MGKRIMGNRGKNECQGRKQRDLGQTCKKVRRMSSGQIHWISFQVVFKIKIYARGISLVVARRGYSQAEMHRPLVAVASRVAEDRLLKLRLTGLVVVA